MDFEVRLSRLFDPQIETLRRECFPGTYPSGSARDRFDSRSLHISIHEACSGILAANGRLCPGPDSFFEEWFQARTEIPTGANILDLGRCLVAPKFRRRGLSKLLLLGATICADELGFDYVVGAVIPRDPMASVSAKIGFKEIGAPVLEKEPSGIAVEVQPLVYDLRAARQLDLDSHASELHRQISEQARHPALALDPKLRRSTYLI